MRSIYFEKRIEQLLNGKFIYEQPELLFSQDRIFATLKAGETTRMRFISVPMTTAGSVAL